VRTQRVTVDAGTAGSAVVVVNIEFTKSTVPEEQYGPSVWPKFHHDNGNTGLSAIDTEGNKGTAKKVFLSAPAPCRSLSSVWRCGTYQASPSLAADGTIYQVGGNGKVYAVDRATLKVKWSTLVGEPMLASAESDITVVKSGHFFVHTHGAGADTPQFFKVLDNKTTGDLVWKNTPQGYDANHKRLDGFDSAPAIDYDGNLYLMNEDASKIGSWDQRAEKLYDVDLAPKTANNFTHGAALTPDKLSFWTSGGTLWALDQVAKKVLWSFQDPAIGKSGVSVYAKNAPMLTKDNVVIATLGWREGTTAATYKFYTRVTAWKLSATKTKLWETVIGPSAAKKGLAPLSANVSADEELRYNLGVTSPAQDKAGNIYIGHADGLYALEPVKGAVKWGYGTASVVSSPAVGADGRVYFGSMDGYVYAVKGGNLVWQVKTGGQVNSSPAIGADGTVYAMSDDGYLYAIK
jgi:outer membrane protein assembly factor BamB